jgi:hypothetical protein
MTVLEKSLLKKTAGRADATKFLTPWHGHWPALATLVGRCFAKDRLETGEVAFIIGVTLLVLQPERVARRGNPSARRWSAAWFSRRWLACCFSDQFLWWRNDWAKNSAAKRRKRRNRKA